MLSVFMGTLRDHPQQTLLQGFRECSMRVSALGSSVNLKIPGMQEKYAQLSIKKVSGCERDMYSMKEPNTYR
jgi:hypothetical protein